MFQNLLRFSNYDQEHCRKWNSFSSSFPEMRKLSRTRGTLLENEIMSDVKKGTTDHQPFSQCCHPADNHSYMMSSTPRFVPAGNWPHRLFRATFSAWNRDSSLHTREAYISHIKFQISAQKVLFWCCNRAPPPWFCKSWITTAHHLNSPSSNLIVFSQSSFIHSQQHCHTPIQCK